MVFPPGHGAKLASLQPGQMDKCARQLQMVPGAHYTNNQGNTHHPLQCWCIQSVSQCSIACFPDPYSPPGAVPLPHYQPGVDWSCSRTHCRINLWQEKSEHILSASTNNPSNRLNQYWISTNPIFEVSFINPICVATLNHRLLPQDGDSRVILVLPRETSLPLYQFLVQHYWHYLADLQTCSMQLLFTTNTANICDKWFCLQSYPGCLLL